jgi:hypothetical protein
MITHDRQGRSTLREEACILANFAKPQLGGNTEPMHLQVPGTFHWRGDPP